jgi:hypothetical protein
VLWRELPRVMPRAYADVIDRQGVGKRRSPLWVSRAKTNHVSPLFALAKNARSGLAGVQGLQVFRGRQHGPPGYCCVIEMAKKLAIYVRTWTTSA